MSGAGEVAQGGVVALTGMGCSVAVSPGAVGADDDASMMVFEASGMTASPLPRGRWTSGTAPVRPVPAGLRRWRPRSASPTAALRVRCGTGLVRRRVYLLGQQSAPTRAPTMK